MARAATLQDSIDSWPDRMDLEGFSYERLGGFGATNQSDAGYRTVDAWISWLGKSNYPGKSFNPEPHSYLAKMLTAFGKRDHAFAVQFAAREAERAEARATGDWRRWAWLSFLRYLFGYGIGPYIFTVVPWVAGSILVGALVLLPARLARAKGVFWCIGASLERLLPIIELNREFSDFFYDPQRNRLRGWQIAFFAVYGLWGWMLLKAWCRVLRAEG